MGRRNDNLGQLFKSAKEANSSHLAQLLSQIETQGLKVTKELPELIDSDQKVFRIGITGPPGAGKSTLISGLIKEFRAKDLKVAVLAIDPSSPFTQGAILGDRIRYSEHFLDEKVFIRSMGTRGSLGGLSGAAYLSLRLLDQMPFDIVLIETVGVGQTELEIVNVADVTMVTLVPESGDAIQAMKAGLSEIADLFVVNKSDRQGADALVKELETVTMPLEADGKAIEIFKTTATSGDGIKKLSEHLLNQKEKLDWQSERDSVSRTQQEAKALLRLQLEKGIHEKASLIQNKEQLKSLID